MSKHKKVTFDLIIEVPDKQQAIAALEQALDAHNNYAQNPSIQIAKSSRDRVMREFATELLESLDG